LLYEPEYSYKLVLPNGTKETDYSTKIKLSNIDLPIHRGDKVGSLEVYNRNNLEHTIDLIAKDNVNSIFAFITENKSITSTLKIILLGLVILTIFTIFIIIRKKSKKIKKSNSNVYSIKSKHSKRRRK
ncbi:MAG: D-alanyl-D-alanine carboxypeptidase family protein, partial [Romboutsia sp.]